MYTLEETIYRPPLEEHSALLEVSVGCSYEMYILPLFERQYPFAAYTY